MEQRGRRYALTTHEGFMAFYDATFDEVYRSAARLTHDDRSEAEDLVQEAFMRLVRAVQEGSVREAGIGWPITAVRRCFIDRLRSAEREGRRLRLVATAAAADARATTDLSILDGLTDRERTVLVLRYIEDLTVADIASLMGSTVRAAESLLQRAKHKARLEARS